MGAAVVRADENAVALWYLIFSSIREGLLPHHQSFLLHPAVLKPYFHLLIAQVQSVRQLFPLLPVDELIHHELILKFSELRFGVRLPLLPRPGLG